MRMSNRVNISAVSLFKEALTQYENTMVPGIVDPIQYEKPASYFQMAMHRLISSNIPDSFQMMRYLAEKMISKSHPYASPTILMLASGSPTSLAKDEILSIAYTLLQVIHGESVVLDDLWMTRVNHNEAIKIFLENYQTSDQKTICHCYKNNLIESLDNEEIFHTEEPRITIDIGDTNKNIQLTDNSVQVIQCRLSPNIVYKEGYREDIPLTVTGSIIVKSSFGEFIVDKKVHFTDTAIEIMKLMGCLVTPYTSGGDTRIKLPAAFFSAKIDLISDDSGNSWICGNIQILPPQLSTYKKKEY